MTWTGIIFLAGSCHNYSSGDTILIEPGGTSAYTYCQPRQEEVGTYGSSDACIKAVRAIVDKPQIKAISGGECSARVERKP